MYLNALCGNVDDTLRQVAENNPPFSQGTTGYSSPADTVYVGIQKSGNNSMNSIAETVYVSYQSNYYQS